MKNLILSVQHLLAMYAGAILVPIIVGTSLKFTPEQIAYLVTVDIFMCGGATFLQANKVTGTGLPIVLGCTFTAVAPMILIGQTKGIDVLYGSLFLSGILVIIIAPFFSHLVKFFPPVVTGSVVTIIGINLMPVAMNYLAGGQGAKDYGDVKNILLGLMTLIIILVLQRFTTGFIKSIAILIGLVLGTIGAGLLGMVDINQVNHAGWLGIPVPFRFSGFSFDVTSTYCSYR